MKNAELKEAVAKYIESKELVLMGYSPEYIDDVKNDMEVAFRAGAEWMARQGVTIEDEVCELYDELYLYYIDDCSSMTPDTSCEMLKELGASKGDKVVVQIRKKQ